MRTPTRRSNSVPKRTVTARWAPPSSWVDIRFSHAPRFPSATEVFETFPDEPGAGLAAENEIDVADRRGSAAMVAVEEVVRSGQRERFSTNRVSRPCRCRARFAHEAIRCECELSSLSMYCPSGQENGLLPWDNLRYTKTGPRTNSSPFIILLFSAYRSVRSTSVVLANSPSSS